MDLTVVPQNILGNKSIYDLLIGSDMSMKYSD